MNIIWFWLRKRPSWTLAFAVAWTLIIFIGCSMPGKELPKVDLFDQFDKVVHFVFFAIFFIFWFLRFSPSPRAAIYVLLAAILYGFGIEFYQKYFVAGRSFDVWDGVADTMGALFGWLILKKIEIES